MSLFFERTSGMSRLGTQERFGGRRHYAGGISVLKPGEVLVTRSETTWEWCAASQARRSRTTDLFDTAKTRSQRYVAAFTAI